ncbi:MAG: hypothetical protein NVV83_10510 [Afipia sp.]|nr:hypothetical protein [Afipia sp.]
MSISPTRLVVIVAGLGIVAYAAKQGSEATPPTPAPAAPAAQPVALPPEPLPELPGLKWGTLDRSYGVLEGDFTLTNTNKFPIKDVILRCDITGGSGTVIRSPTFVVYETVPANGKKTVRKFNFGFWPSQGKSFACNTALK